MVNQDLVKYLREGKRRGFNVSILKQKLIQGGFSPLDVDMAINIVEGKPIKKEEVKEPIVKAVPSVKPESLKDNKNIIQSKKPLKIKTGELKWLKISGIMGIVILIFSTFFSIIDTVMKGKLTTTITSNLVVSILFGLVILVLIALYFIGFVNLGKKTDVRSLRVGGWMMMLSPLVLTIFGVVGYLIYNSSISVVSPTIIGLIGVVYLFVSQLIFSVGLVKSGKKEIELSKGTGIFNLIIIIFFLLLSIVGVVMIISVASTVSGVVASGGNLIDSLFEAVVGLLVVVFVGAFLIFLKFIEYILEIIVLLKASKQFEMKKSNVEKLKVLDKKV